MRTGLLTLIVLIGFSYGSCWQATTKRSFADSQTLAASSLSIASQTKPDFDKQIKPILQARCQPCHFQGGKVYDKLPFDRAETITKLGTKLFTRIKDEKEQRLIRAFFAQP